MSSAQVHIMERPQNRSTELVDLARHAAQLEVDRLEGHSTRPLHYPSRAEILKLLAELRRELHAIRKATEALERIASVYARRRDPRHRGLHRV